MSDWPSASLSPLWVLGFWGFCWVCFCPCRPPSDSRLDIQLTATERRKQHETNQWAADQTQFNQFNYATRRWTDEVSSEAENKSAFFFMKICVLCRCVETDRRSGYLPQTEASRTYLFHLSAPCSASAARDKLKILVLWKKKFLCFFLLKLKCFKIKDPLIVRTIKEFDFW